MNEPQANIPNISSTKLQETAQKPRVIVIDDSRMVRLTIKKVLATEFDIIEAGDGEEGWDKLLADHKIQAVLTDAGMPKLDGYDLIKRIRAHDDNRLFNIPIMMITGAEVDATETREYALKIGASDFITKPFDKSELIARVRGYTKLDQTQRNLETTEEALAEQSVIDTTTNIHNKRYFLERGEQDLAFIKRRDEDLSIIAIDIDKFGELSKEHGETISTGILNWSANTVKELLRKEDTVARVERSRFAVIAPDTSRMPAAILCERIRKHFSATPYTYEDVTLTLTISIGLSCFTRENVDSIEALLDIAEKRSEQALISGGNKTKTSSEDKQDIPIVTKQLSVDKALYAIKNSEADKLKPFLLMLARQIMPILVMCNKTFHWQLDSQLTDIQNKINE